MPEENQQPVSISVDLVEEVELAYLVTDGDVTVWLPKSQVMDIEDHGDDHFTFVIPEWLAEEEGLI